MYLYLLLHMVFVLFCWVKLKEKEIAIYGSYLKTCNL